MFNEGRRGIGMCSRQWDRMTKGKFRHMPVLDWERFVGLDQSATR
jgi:hypothetical protein